MRKLKKNQILILIIILFTIVISPLSIKAEANNCPSESEYINNYFDLAAHSLSSRKPYVKSNNTITFYIKKDYVQYVTTKVNDSPATFDDNGVLVVDLVAEKNKGNTITHVNFEFTAAPSLTTSPCKAEYDYTFTPTVKESPLPDDQEIVDIKNQIDSTQESNTLIDELNGADFVKVTDPTKTTKLMCNYDKNDGKTVKKYTYTGEKASNIADCKVTCREDVVVTFDPPVITQSGMCFSYVADIKTKSVCQAKFTRPKPTELEGCIASSDCSGGGHEGGPIDSFDACVESCDNGEYTQSCINKCYNKVYEKNNSTLKTSSTNSKKESSVTYLNSLKNNNALPELMDSSSLKKVKVETTKTGKVIEKTCYTDDYLISTSNLSYSQLVELANDVYASKIYLPGGYYGQQAGKEWTPSDGYLYYDISKGIRKWNSKGGCRSNVNYYYFSSPSMALDTIKKLNGTDDSSPTGLHKQYEAVNGSLKRKGYIINGKLETNRCPEDCEVDSSCSNQVSSYGKTDNKIVTSKQAKEIYKAELAKYNMDKKNCLASAKDTCVTRNSNYVIKTDEISKNSGNNLGNTYTSTQTVTHSTTSNNKNNNSGSFPTMIINTNGVCVTGSCDDSNSEYCSNLDSVKNASDLVGFCKDKESCKNSGTQACKEGNTCYDYHTTISFPKNYMNVKTGQTKVEISKDKLPYYVSLGNAYCTNLSTKEVNTAWYDYKLDDTNKTAKPAESKIKKNITAKINDYGIFKWNFDLSCFFAIKNPTTGECNGDDCKEKKCTGTDCDDGVETPLSNAKVRSVDTTDLFPNREPRFNWSSKAKNVSNQSYEIDPESLVKEIETLGNAVYDTDKENQNVDYHIVLTPSDINDVRKYNKEKKTYNDADNGTGVNKIAGEKVWGVTVYRSKLLDTHGNIVKKRGLLGCNNQSSANTCATEGGK